MKDVIEKIKRLRIHKKISQDEIAKMADLSRVSYTYLESGKTNPESLKLTSAIGIAKALDYPFDELFGIDQNETFQNGLKNEIEQLDNQIAELYKQQDYHLELIRGKRSLFRLIYSQLSTIISQLETNPDNTNILELKASLASIVQAIDELENFSQLEIDLETRKKERDEKRALKAKQRE